MTQELGCYRVAKLPYEKTQDFTHFHIYSFFLFKKFWIYQSQPQAQPITAAHADERAGEKQDG